MESQNSVVAENAVKGTPASYGEIFSKAAIGAGSGAVVGGAIVASAFLVTGLTPAGPIAGGLFASSMGAGLSSGSGLASLQAASMTSTAYLTGAGVGSVLGGLYGATAAGERGEANQDKKLRSML